MAGAVGWTYRKDWWRSLRSAPSSRPSTTAELEPPKTWDELLEVAKFFTGKEIDGKKVYGAYIFTERGSEGITMGVTNAMYNYGFDYMNSKQPYHMDGVVNSAGAAKGMDVYKELFKCCQPQGLTNAYMSEGLDAFKSGQVAMQMNWYAFFPGLAKDPNVGGDKIGFFKNPAGPAGDFTQLGGQGLSGCGVEECRRRLLLHEVVRAAGDSAEVDGSRRRLASKAVLLSDAYKNSAPYAPSFVESMGMVKDFWAEPLYVPLLLDMQNRVHDYVVADKGTSQKALDELVKDWVKVFKQEGKNPS